MDSSPDVLVQTVRAKRRAIDEDLRQLRGKLVRVDPRRAVNPRQLAGVVVPFVAGTAAVWAWTRRRRRVHSLDQLLVHGLTDLFHIERQFLPVIDRMRVQATNDELAHAFAQHRLETEGHLDRLRRVFESVGARPRGGPSSAMEALVADSERLRSRGTDRDVRDAWLIATAQRIGHLQIAGYGAVRTYADLLGFAPAAQLLQQTLEEERAADQRLTRLAEGLVNPLSVRASGTS